MPYAASPRGGRAGEPSIDCAGLLVRYGTATAVDGLSFQAWPGQVLALLGPNGAGKTSTVEALEGYRRPSGGRVRVLGLDPRTQQRQLMPRIGVMLQRGGLYPMLAPARALRLFAAYYRRPEDPQALLERLDLTEAAATPWRHLSGGEQQRLSLALALVGRPEVVFLDEPTAGVDPEGRVTVRQVIADLAARGVSVLLTTHELGEAERMADRVLIVRAGRAVLEGAPSELAAAGAPAVVFDALAGLDTAALGTALSATVVERGPGHYEVAATATPQLTAALTSWLADHDIGLSELRAGRSLEETYLEVVGEAAAASRASPPTQRTPRATEGAPSTAAGEDPPRSPDAPEKLR